MRTLLWSSIVIGVYLIATASAIADDASYRQAAEELLEVLNMQEALNRAMEQMLEIQIQQNPQIGAFKNVMKRFFEKHMKWESLKEEFVAMYMEEFTEEEIDDLIAFYQTPTGQKTVRQVPVLMAKGTRIGARRINEKMPELYRMIQQKNERIKAKEEKR